jgi:hypothetical protein
LEEVASGDGDLVWLGQVRQKSRSAAARLPPGSLSMNSFCMVLSVESHWA